MQDDSHNTQPLPPALFRLAFRSFFLFGGLFSLIAMSLWLLMTTLQVDISPYGGALFWHSHEMLFGFVCAIVVGFLLTAVQTWTGVPSVKGTPLIILFLVWLAGRLGALHEWSHPIAYVIIDMSFLPLAAFFLTRPLVRVRQYRNLFFVPVLLGLTLANLLMHLGQVNQASQLYLQGSHLSIWLVVFIMSVLGGRVIPMFTANGTGTAKTHPVKILELTTLGATLLLALIFSLNLQWQLPNQLLGLIFLVCACAHSVRFLRWRFWVGLRKPLVWSLHSAYAFIPLGMLAYAGHYLGWLQTSPTTLLHFFTAGAMGALILAMMSRVALGHTGRPLTPPSMLTWAYGCIAVAGLTRSLGITLLPDWHGHWVLLSGLTWIAAFAIFSWYYLPILINPRADGRPG